MKSTRKTKLTALFLVLITLLSALFIPTSAAEMDTSENVGIEEIMPSSALYCENEYHLFYNPEHYKRGSYILVHSLLFPLNLIRSWGAKIPQLLKNEC